MQFTRIFVLTGAGLSAESGLGTFRDTGGLWANFNIEEVATLDGYERDPAKVLNFYNMRRTNLLEARHNAAHEALARLEREWRALGGEIYLCTQNIDDLLEQAGAERVVHMHGELKKWRCHDCDAIGDADGDLLTSMGCPSCGRDGGLRPHVVWFGETPLFMDEIFDALGRADLFVAIGTSGAVYPAAGFVDFARHNRVPCLEINLAPSDNAEVFTDARYGKATEIVPAWVEELLAGAAASA